MNSSTNQLTPPFELPDGFADARAHPLIKTTLALIMTAAIVLISLYTLWGWQNNSLTATSWIAGFSTMKINSALLFIACALGLGGVWRRQERIAAACGLGVMLVAAITLLQTVLNFNVGIDQLFGKDAWDQNHPGRMSLGTAVSFGLAGAILAVHFKYPQQRTDLYDILVVAYLIIPLFTFFSYIFAPGEVLATPFIGSMAIPTTVAFLCFFFAISLLTHGPGAAGLLNRNSSNARQFRLLFSMVLILPLCLGSALNLGVQEGWIGTGIGTAIFCLFTTLIVTSTLVHHTLAQDKGLQQLLNERRRTIALNERLHELLDASGDGVLMFDQQLKVIHANSGAQHILGYAPEELNGMPVWELMAEAEQDPDYISLERFISDDKSPQSLDLKEQWILRSKDGTDIPVAATLSKKTNVDETWALAIVKNITELEGRIRPTERKSYVDPLTRLSNQAEFEKLCRQTQYKMQRKSDGPVTVLMLDIDDFNVIKEDYGHTIADRVLKAFADIIANTLRDKDRLFRLNDEAFVIVAEKLARQDALALAERLRRTVRKQAVTINQTALQITCSIGIFVNEGNSVDLKAAAARADEAMYIAKQQGKDQSILAESPRED